MLWQEAADRAGGEDSGENPVQPDRGEAVKHAGEEAAGDPDYDGEHDREEHDARRRDTEEAHQAHLAAPHIHVEPKVGAERRGKSPDAERRHEAKDRAEIAVERL